MSGRQGFTVAFIGVVNADEQVVKHLSKYGILLDMLGITIRTSVCTNTEAAIVRHAKNRYVFLPGRPLNGYTPEVGKPIIERRIFLSPTALAYATARKYGDDDNLDCAAASVHSLMGYSLKFPSDLVMVYYPRGSKPNDARLSIIAAFVSKHKRPIINTADEGWEGQLTDILADAGFARKVEVDGGTLEGGL